MDPRLNEGRSPKEDDGGRRLAGQSSGGVDNDALDEDATRGDSHGVVAGAPTPKLLMRRRRVHVPFCNLPPGSSFYAMLVTGCVQVTIPEGGVAPDGCVEVIDYITAPPPEHHRA